MSQLTITNIDKSNYMDVVRYLKARDIKAASHITPLDEHTSLLLSILDGKKIKVDIRDNDKYCGFEYMNNGESYLDAKNISEATNE